MDNKDELMEQQNEASEAEDTSDEADVVEVTEATEEKDAEKSEKKKGNILNDIIEIAESTLITVFVIVMIFTYILHPVNIKGGSMMPTLNNTYVEGERETDKIFMTTVYLGIKKGDILVIDKSDSYLLGDDGKTYNGSYPINQCIIKRVIACPGQTIDIRDDQVIVDGEVIDEPYVMKGAATRTGGAFDSQYPITIPEGYYFVMGDNREHSTDSRFPSVGLVKKEQIYGKAIIKYSPLSEFDILTNSDKGDCNEK